MSNSILSEIPARDMNENLQNLLDASTFVEFRDYYLRVGMLKLEYRHLLNTGDTKEITRHLQTKYVFKTKYTEYAKRLEKVLNLELTPAQQKSLEKNILDAQHTKTNTPYERVGKILEYIKSLKKENIRIIKHSEFRNILEHILLDWTCRDLYQAPAESISKEGIDKTLIKLIHKKREESTLEWKNIWSLKRSAHKSESEEPDDTIPEIYYEDRRIVRNKLRNDLSSEEILLTSRLFRYGYMYNKLSWPQFQEFLERQYILISNEKSFDKVFFSEWLSGYNWSTPENKNKYNNLVKEGIKQWISMIAELVEEQIDYLFPLRIHKPASKPVYKWNYSNKELNNNEHMECRVLNYDNLYQTLTVQMLDKHPILYMYKDFLTAFNKNKEMESLTENEIDTYICNNHPKLHIINTLLNMNDESIYIADNWHSEQQKLNLMLNPNTVICEMPIFEDDNFTLNP